jgi:hypothetical protein
MFFRRTTKKKAATKSKEAAQDQGVAIARNSIIYVKSAGRLLGDQIKINNLPEIQRMQISSLRRSWRISFKNFPRLILSHLRPSIN